MTLRYAHIRYRKTFDKQEYETKGGITFCYEFLGDGLVKAAKAVCSDKDNYCRAIGRAVSRGRFEASKAKMFDYKNYQEGNIIDFLLDVDWS